MVASAQGYAIHDPKLGTYNFKIEKYDVPIDDDMVLVHVECCGVCGSDHHTVSGGWGPFVTKYVVTGHEIIGEVAQVGKNVKEFKVGQRVGIGAQAGSCGKCSACKADLENYCPEPVHTYNCLWPDGTEQQGGYSTHVRAQERFVFAIPDAISSTDAASMLCGGLTVFSPLLHAEVGPGKKVGVVGLGGLGHYAVLFAKALGAEVTVFSRGDAKKADALKMGADVYVSTSEEGFSKGIERSLDVVVCTASNANLPLTELLLTLGIHKDFVFVGMPEEGYKIRSNMLSGNGAAIKSSHIGSKPEVVQMLKLAADKGVKPWVQVIPMKDADKAMFAVKDNTVRYRTVLVQDIDKSA